MKRETMGDTDSTEESPAILPPGGGDAPQSGSVFQRFKAWVRGLSPGAIARLYFLGVVVVCVGSCYLFSPEPTQVRMHIYGPAENVFIDGVPVTRLKGYDAGPRSTSSCSVTEEKPEYEITIRNGDQVVSSKKIRKGAYLINATTDSWVATESITYGAGDYKVNLTWDGSASYEIKPSGLGVYQMNGNPQYPTFGFRTEPPFQLSRRSTGIRGGGGSKPSRYLKLHAGKIETGKEEDRIPEEGFGSIDRINQEAGGTVIDINAAYGPKGVRMREAKVVLAFELGGFEGGEASKPFAGQVPKGEPVSVDRRDAAVLLSEKHVGVYGSGEFEARFALVFGGEKDEITVLLVSPPQPEKGMDRWHVMEAESGNSAPVDKVAGEFLAGVWKKLSNRARKQD